MIISYGGAMVVLPAVLLWRAGASDGGGVGLTWFGVLSAAMWMGHFLRRTAESAWLHRFGASRLPWGQVAYPWVYYWGFAAWIGSALAGAEPVGPGLLVAGLALFVTGEAGNFRAHLLLRRLRGGDGSPRKIPRGFLFDRVSCPHYFFEIISWVGFTLLTGLASAAVFTLVSAAILTTWATQRHRAYLGEFDGRDGREAYPAGRRVIFPFLY